MRPRRASFARGEGTRKTLTERVEEPACKPDSVPPKRWRPSLWEPRLRDPQGPRAHAADPEASSGPLAPAVRSPRPKCSLLGLAPDGVCRAAAVARRAGELLPHRFTLTCARRPSAVCSLWHFPRVAPPGCYPASCPAESGLSSTSPPRPPGRLLRSKYRREIAGRTASVTPRTAGGCRRRVRRGRSPPARRRPPGSPDGRPPCSSPGARARTRRCRTP